MHLIDLVLGGFEGLDDAVQLDAAGLQTLLQLALLLLQPAQVRPGPAQLRLLALQVRLLGLDLSLERRDLGARRGEKREERKGRVRVGANMIGPRGWTLTM